MNQKKIGNILIFCGLALICYTIYPVLLVYLFPTKMLEGTPSGFMIQIPNIHAQAMIVPDVDPWHEQIYNKALEKGVAQAAGSALPNNAGMMFLFAHSSVAPWEITRQNTAFLRLGELRKGDRITVFYKGKRYVYFVHHIKEVWPTDVQYLKNLKGNGLILQTCTPIGTAFKRLLIFASKT